LNIKLRLEQPEDYRIVEELTREAFWGLDSPGCVEHLLVHKLRTIPAFVPDLDYVAEFDGKIIGNVMYAKAKIIDDTGKQYEVLEFSPLSVLPEYQNQGVGKALLKHTIEEAKRLGYRAILFFGEPDYYPRLGFQRAGVFNIATAWGANFDAFMAMPLYDDALNGISGRFYLDPVYDVDAEEAAEFDNTFPYKEKHILAPINILLENLTPPAKEAFGENKITLLAELRKYSGREIVSWHGIDRDAMFIINTTLKDHGYPPKIWPERTESNSASFGVREGSSACST